MTARWLVIVAKGDTGVWDPITAALTRAFPLEEHTVLDTTTAWRTEGATLGLDLWRRRIVHGADFEGTPLYRGAILPRSFWPIDGEGNPVLAKGSADIVHAFLMAARPMWTWNGSRFGAIQRVERVNPVADDFTRWARAVLG